MNKPFSKNLACILLFFLSFYNFVNAQVNTPLLERIIDLNLEDNTLQEAFDKLEAELKIPLAYSTDFLSDQKFSIQFKKETLRNILKQLLKDTELAYLVQKQRIIILHRDSELLKEQEQPKRKYTISGYLKDAESGEELIGGTITLLKEEKGCTSNAYGFFSLTVEEGTHELECNYLGFQSKQIPLELKENTRLEIELSPGTDLQEIVVTSTKTKADQSVSKEDFQKFDLKDLKNMPALFGEGDIFGALQLLPGVQSTGAGNGGLSVRGGSGDQNLILLDEAPVYNPAHLLGIFSIFNQDAIKDVRLLKGEIPTEYRGRISSVIDIRMKEGNNKKFGMFGGIGLIMAKLGLEGQLGKGKGSYMLAGRRSYLDLFFNAFNEESKLGEGLYFYDVNAKVNYRIGEKSRLFFSLYFGKDVFNASNNFNLNWGNQTATLRWNKIYNDKLFSNTSLIVSNFNFISPTYTGDLVSDSIEILSLSLKTKVRDIHLKQSFNYYLNPSHTLKFGLNTIHHTFIPGELIDPEDANENLSKERYAVELSAYMSDNWELNRQWKIDYGLHFSSLSILGYDDNIYDYDEFGNILDSTFYAREDVVEVYGGVEPRLSISWSPNSRGFFKIGYAHTIQYLQLLNSSFVNNPSSAWVPSTNNIKPQRANQFNLGYFFSFAKGKLDASIEAYFSRRNNQIEYRTGALLEAENDIEPNLIFGKGETAGLEFLLKKPTGKFRGWISYTYSRSYNQFSQIDNNIRFAATEDRPHNFAIIGIWEKSKAWTFSASWTYVSGKLVTVPSGKYELNGNVIDFYTKRNNYRMSDHHKLDISIQHSATGKKGAKRRWQLSIHNVYAHRNPELLFIGPQDGVDSAIEITPLLFVPSFGYYFDF